MENPCTLVTFGDSITKGYTPYFAKTFSQEYPDISINIINEGVVSDTSRQGKARLESILSHKPNVVIVGFGMNDWRKGVTEEEFHQNLHTIIERLENASIRVIVMTIIPDYQGVFKGTSAAIERYNAIIKDVAHRKRVRIVDINALWKREIGPIFRGLYDPIHPNKKGYELMCKALMHIVPRRNTTIVWQFSGEHCACNYKCPYCYVPSDVNVGEHFVGTIERWHEAFKDAFGNQHLTFYLSFGEPMIQKHFYDVIDMVESEPNWEVIMTTNLSRPLERLVNRPLAEEGRLNINASFHPTETTIDAFLQQLLFLREHGIECPIVFVMYPPLMKDFPGYFREFNKHHFLFHIRRFRATYQEKSYPEAYTEEERQFIARYMDSASIKYMLSNVQMEGKLSYAGMFYMLVTNQGDIALCPDYHNDYQRGNILEGYINLDLEPHPLPQIKDGTADGVASLVELNYHELEGNHILAFAKQGGVYHTDQGVNYSHLQDASSILPPRQHARTSPLPHAAWRICRRMLAKVKRHARG